MPSTRLGHDSATSSRVEPGHPCRASPSSPATSTRARSGGAARQVLGLQRLGQLGNGTTTSSSTPVTSPAHQRHRHHRRRGHIVRRAGRRRQVLGRQRLWPARQRHHQPRAGHRSAGSAAPPPSPRASTTRAPLAAEGPSSAGATTSWAARQRDHQRVDLRSRSPGSPAPPPSPPATCTRARSWPAGPSSAGATTPPGSSATGPPPARPVPVTVTGITGATAITAGTSTVRDPGRRDHQVLGPQRSRVSSATGPPPARSSPVTVTGITGARRIAAGDAHSCAVAVGGTIRCWGDNPTGSSATGPTAARRPRSPSPGSPPPPPSPPATPTLCHPGRRDHRVLGPQRRRAARQRDGDQLDHPGHRHRLTPAGEPSRPIRARRSSRTSASPGSRKRLTCSWGSRLHVEEHPSGPLDVSDELEPTLAHHGPAHGKARSRPPARGPPGEPGRPSRVGWRLRLSKRGPAAVGAGVVRAGSARVRGALPRGSANPSPAEDARARRHERGRGPGRRTGPTASSAWGRGGRHSRRGPR